MHASRMGQSGLAQGGLGQTALGQTPLGQTSLGQTSLGQPALAPQPLSAHPAPGASGPSPSKQIPLPAAPAPAGRLLYGSAFSRPLDLAGGPGSSFSHAHHSTLPAHSAAPPPHHSQQHTPVRVSTTAFSAQDLGRLHGGGAAGNVGPGSSATGARYYGGGYGTTPQAAAPPASGAAVHPALGAGGLGGAASFRAHGFGGYARGPPRRGEDDFEHTGAAQGGLDGSRAREEEAAGSEPFAFSPALLGGPGFRDGGPGGFRDGAGPQHGGHAGHHAGGAFDAAIPGVGSLTAPHPLGLTLPPDFVADGLQRRYAARARARPGRRASQMSEKEKKDRHNAHTRSSRKRIDNGLQALKDALLKSNPALRLNKKADIVDAAVKFVNDTCPMQLQESSLSS